MSKSRRKKHDVGEHLARRLKKVNPRKVRVVAGIAWYARDQNPLRRRHRDHLIVYL